MPRRPASPGLIVTLAAAGALVAGAAGTGAYLGVTEYLADRPGTGDPTDPNSTETGGPGESPSTPSATPCPEEIAAAVRDEGGRGELTQVIYVKGALDGRPSAEAWI